MSSSAPDQIRESRYRYINLTVYLLAAIVNSFPAQTFSSINSNVEEKFQITALLVTLNTLLFPICHPIAAVPVNWILDIIGMKFGCALGGIILIAGVWLRTLLQVGSPGLCIAGSTLAAIGNIFILNSPSKLASQWFRADMIPIVISIAVLACNVSVTAGASIPALVLGANASVDQIKNFLRLEAIIVTIPITLMIIMLRSKPRNLPSQVASSEQVEQFKQPYIDTLKQMFTNREYILIMFAMSFSYGTMVSVLATLEQCLNSLGYEKSGTISSLVILSAMLIGIVSTVGFSIFIKKTLAFRTISTILLIGAFFSLAGLFLLLVVDVNPQTNIYIILVSCCAGIFLVPQSSILLGYASEVVYPLGQASASGYQYAVSQTFGFLLGLGVIAFIDKENKWKVYAVFGVEAGLFLLGALFMILTKQNLKRHRESLRLSVKKSISEGKLGESLLGGSDK